MSEPVPPPPDIDPASKPAVDPAARSTAGDPPVGASRRAATDPEGPGWLAAATTSTSGSRVGAWWATITRRRTGIDPRAMPGPGEELAEHIPWERLTVDPGPRRRWPSYVLASLALAGLVVGLWMLRGPEADLTVVTLPPPAVAPSLEPAAGPTAPAGPSGSAAQEPAPPAPGPAQVVSEADLLAYVPVPAMAAAAARAEWFVTDYFSTTDPARDQKLASAYAGGTLPSTPPGPPAYVDWVRALHAELEPDQTVTVTVLYRILVADGGDFATGPVQAVAVEVVVGPDGGTAVRRLPRPVTVPEGPSVPAPVRQEPVEPPPAVTAKALDQLGETLRDPQVVRALPSGSAWRIWIEGADASGLRWVYEVSLATPLGADGRDGPDSLAGNG